MAQQCIEVLPMNKIGQDDRGETYDYKTRDNSDYIFIKRKEGSLSGNTYHEGKCVNTNPKIFVLLAGEVDLQYRHIKEKEHHIVSIKFPSVIKIKPYVTHAIKALTDILILECNSIKDIQEDRVREMVVLET
jgi:hypothetical protein